MKNCLRLFLRFSPLIASPLYLWEASQNITLLNLWKYNPQWSHIGAEIDLFLRSLSPRYSTCHNQIWISSTRQSTIYIPPNQHIDIFFYLPRFFELVLFFNLRFFTRRFRDSFSRIRINFLNVSTKSMKSKQAFHFITVSLSMCRVSSHRISEFEA